MSSTFKSLFGLLALAVTVAGCNCGQPTFDCQTDVECASEASRKICDKVTNACVECTEDTQCASGVCREDGSCGACRFDADCSAGNVCDQGSFTCVPGCSDLNGSCPAGQRCLPGTTSCVACLDSSDCGTGEVCDSATHACVAGCSAAHPSCPSGLTCDPSAGLCVACLTSSDCKDPAKPSCDVPAHTCVECTGPGQCADPVQPVCDTTRKTCETCVDNAHCVPGTVCKQHACVPGCSATQACPAGLVCDPTGACVTCVGDADCKTPAVPACDVATNSCVECNVNQDCKTLAKPFCDAASQTCQECLSDGECGAGELCQQNACVPGCSASKACGPGLTCEVSRGQCVICTDDSQCGAGAPRCNVATNTCVACLPGASDNCPSGEVCRPDQVCERGCKSGVGCPNGVCLPGNSCETCSADTQCAAGKVCGPQGSCIDSCGGETLCGGADACCGGHCQDTQNDPNNCGGCGIQCGAGGSCCQGQCTNLQNKNNCGACGTVCGSGQDCCAGACKAINVQTSCGACGVVCAADHFCDGATCRPETFPNFCANKKVYVIYDQIAVDDAAANVLASTITQNCSSQTQIFYGPQTDPTRVDQTTGQPLVGAGSTVVLAGGPWPNKPVKWLERTKLETKVFYAQNATVQPFQHYFRSRATNLNVSTINAADCSTSRDQFVVELVTDPANGTLALISYGACPGGKGTQVGAWFWANVMLPNASTYTDSWYVFEWRDGNADLLPNTGDTFTKLASGQ